MGRFSMLSAAALAISSTFAAPLVKRQMLTDLDILQFALTLEHLENVFYKLALRMPESDFIAAGFDSAYYSNLKYVSMDEQSHVDALTAGISAVGGTPVQQCEYSFPFTDPTSFVALASVLEGVGTSAYLGAAPAIQSTEYLTIAGSILVTEAIHTSLQRVAVGQVAAANPYGTPLGANPVFTLAAAFIVSCPASNPVLPFMAFPTLTATQGIPSAPGLTFTFSTTEAVPAGSFITFVNGLSTISVPATSMGGGMISTTIPTTVMGQAFAVLTNANTTMLMDSQVIAGPAILEVTPNAPMIDLTI